jgi:hypothetical protein
MDNHTRWFVNHQKGFVFVNHGKGNIFRLNVIFVCRRDLAMDRLALPDPDACPDRTTPDSDGALLNQLLNPGPGQGWVATRKKHVQSQILIPLPDNVCLPLRLVHDDLNV